MSNTKGTPVRILNTLEKIQFVLENSPADIAAKLISNTDQNSEVSIIEERLLKGCVYTAKSADVAFKAAMIIAINNGTI